MTAIKFYGRGLPRVHGDSLPGKLIVLEGPDGVGRSTQIALLREWLEASGYAVYSSGLKRSELASVGIAAAKQGHTLGNHAMALFYAADLADRLEREMLSMLRAGFVVLTDRYFYSLVARYLVRGIDAEWLRSLFGFALVPDAILYMRSDVEHLMARVLSSRSFDYWESGMDYTNYSDYYEGFTRYQTEMLATFDRLGQEYGFISVDANLPIREVFVQLRDQVAKVVADLKPASLPSEGGAAPITKQG